MNIQLFQNSGFRKKIKLEELADIFINEMNLRRSDVVLVHSSLHRAKFSNFKPEDLIFLIKMIIGTDGTLLMPVLRRNNLTQSDYGSKENKPNILQFNDLVTEEFLKKPDTVLGLNAGITLAAWGNRANSIIDNHCKSESVLDTDKLGNELNQMKSKLIGFGFPVSDFLISCFSGNAGIKHQIVKKSGIPCFCMSFDREYGI